MSESKENNESVVDDFQLRVRDILEKKIKPSNDQKIIIMKHFQESEITSSHVTLKKKDFIEKCKKVMLDISIGTLTKLFNELNSEYGIIKGRCSKIDNHQIFEAKSLVYISKTCTKDIVNDKLIDESELKHAKCGGRLFQLLKWTIRLNQFEENVGCYTSENKIEFLVINSELHDRNGSILYMLCIKNDKRNKQEKWQLVKLITAKEIEQCIGNVQLPKGLRQHVAIQRFHDFQQYVIKSKIVSSDLNYKEYLQLKMIKTKSEKHQKSTLEITLSEFIKGIQTAITKYEMIPIISMVIGNNKRKIFGSNYSIDLLLPVKIKDEWIAICYRYDVKQTRWIPFQVLFDQYDIINKAILYSPKFDANKLSFFKNTICKIVLKRETLKSKPSKSNQPRQGPSKENSNGADGDSSFQFPPYHQEPSQEDDTKDNNGGGATYHYSNGVNSNENKESYDYTRATLDQDPINSFDNEGDTDTLSNTNANPIDDNTISTTNNTMTLQHTQHQNINATAPGYSKYVARNQQAPISTQDTFIAYVPCMVLPLPSLPTNLPPEVQMHIMLLHYQVQQYQPLSTFYTNNSINSFTILPQNQSTNNYYNYQFMTQPPIQPMQVSMQQQNSAIINN